MSRPVLRAVCEVLLVLTWSAVCVGQEPPAKPRSDLPSQSRPAAEVQRFSGVLLGTEAGHLSFQLAGSFVNGTLLLGGKRFEIDGYLRKEGLALRGIIDDGNQVTLNGVQVEAAPGSRLIVYQGTWTASLDQQDNKGVWVVHLR